MTLCIAKESQNMGIQRAPSCEASVSSTNTLCFILVCMVTLYLSGRHLTEEYLGFQIAPTPS